MGRVAKGTVRILCNKELPERPRQWHAKWTRADGSRTEWTPLDPAINLDDRAGAEACAASMAPEVRAASANGGKGESVAQYADRWHKWRESRGLVCVGDDRTRMKTHVFDVIGPLSVTRCTRRDLEKLVERLDERIADKSIGWKVASMAWSNVRRMFKDACSSKRLDLRVREDNPADNVQGPDAGMKKSKQYLWPSEFRTLVSCPLVPFRWRRLFALAVYTYTRAGELAALDWEDVDLEHMTIHVHRSVERVRKATKGKVKPTKTGVSRRIPIEPTFLPFLKALRAEAGGKGRVVTAMPSAGMLSRKLKVYLGRAEVKRAELFATDDTRKAITFHDLRATGITWMAARGDDPLRIKQRAGHATFSTTEGYIREAENLGASFGGVFPALPKSLLRIAPESTGAIRKVRKRGKTSRSVVGATGIEPVTSSV